MKSSSLQKNIGEELKSTERLSMKSSSLQTDYRRRVQVYRRIIGEEFMSTDPVSVESSSLQKDCRWRVQVYGRIIGEEFKSTDGSSAKSLSVKSSDLQKDYQWRVPVYRTVNEEFKNTEALSVHTRYINNFNKVTPSTLFVNISKLICKHRRTSKCNLE